MRTISYLAAYVKPAHVTNPPLIPCHPCSLPPGHHQVIQPALPSVGARPQIPNFPLPRSKAECQIIQEPPPFTLVWRMELKTLLGP